MDNATFTENNWLISSPPSQGSKTRLVVKPLVNGKVKRWLIHRGFGFIESRDYDEDIYANINEVKDRVQYLLKGQRVKFEVKDTDRGLEAVKVEIIPEWA